MMQQAKLERQQQIAVRNKTLQTKTKSHSLNGPLNFQALLVKLETLSSSLETLHSRSSSSTEQFVSQISKTREAFKQELRDVLEVQDQRWKVGVILDRE